MSIGAALALIGFTMEILPTVNGVNLVYGSAIVALLAVHADGSLHNNAEARFQDGRRLRVDVTFSRWICGQYLAFMGMTLETMPYLALIALAAVFTIGIGWRDSGYSSFIPLAIGGALPVDQFPIASTIFALLVLLNIFRAVSGFRIISVVLGNWNFVDRNFDSCSACRRQDGSSQ